MTTNTGESEAATGDACGRGTCGGAWRLPMLLALVLAAIVLARLTRERESVVGGDAARAPVETVNAASPTGQSVSLVVRFDSGVERRFDAVAWHDGMTVDDLLTAASRLPNGIKYSIRGSGASALLTEIDDTPNEGARGRNWTYTVNDARADRSFAVYPLKPGDHVLWTFAAAE